MRCEKDEDGDECKRTVFLTTAIFDTEKVEFS